jgi:hypothetical protein
MADAVTEIRQYLEAIRLATEKSEWSRKLEIMELMLSTHQSIISHAKKLTEPIQKTVKQTVTVPKTKTIKRYVNMQAPQQDNKPDTKSLQPIKPIPPLGNQQDNQINVQ